MFFFIHKPLLFYEKVRTLFINLYCSTKTKQEDNPGFDSENADAGVLDTAVEFYIANTRVVQRL